MTKLKFSLLALIGLVNLYVSAQIADSVKYNLQDSSLVIFHRGINPFFGTLPVTVYVSNDIHPNLWNFGCTSRKLSAGQYSIFGQELIKRELVLSLEKNQIYIVKVRVVGIFLPIDTKPILLNRKQTEKYLKKRKIQKELKTYCVVIPKK